MLLLFDISLTKKITNLLACTYMNVYILPLQFQFNLKFSNSYKILVQQAKSAELSSNFNLLLFIII